MAMPGLMDKLPFPVIVPDWSEVPAKVKAFTTTREGGFSLGPFAALDSSGGLNLGDHVGDDPQAVQKNRDKLNLTLPADVIFLSQVHGNMVLDAANLQPGSQADAVLTNQAATVCAVLTADCLPVLFTDMAGSVVAAAHAGWRGLAGGALENTVAAMRARGAGELVAWLGPAIGSSQFEVGRDVFDAFAAKIPNLHAYFRIKGNEGGVEKYLADIYGLARNLLNDIGVTRIYGGDHCTVSETAEFYSYRRDKVCGRMASLIWIDGGPQG
ncbi:peptidoglycan editing factor PgeF [Undibacterium sp. TS12]|uniref:peptidoglycan editing factor PgeF n=1 Tax=Undibacterium sp. TS12 TaxID=2908202 RepID=UPI001F4CEC84|nr:peptidoglycan editing factor PgeF [Undibacterium sp. TS12]MCH8621708.1 peptidoglycan editing factor PgeF [Undibacterium sp. TS12]